MKAVLLVALGGAIGSVARYELSTLVMRHAHDWRFPLGTFVVNVLGCLAAGILAGYADRHALLPAEARLFVFAGLLGGFTTFSAFGLETVHLLKRGDVAVAAANVALSVLAGLLALWIGMGATSLAGAAK